MTDGSSVPPEGQRRLDALERELRRVHDDAQREADAMFAQYQLSQLLASGEPLPVLAGAVAAEVRRLCRARSVTIWLIDAGSTGFQRVAEAGTTAGPDERLPDAFPTEVAAEGWAREQGEQLLSLSDDRTAGLLLIRPVPDRALDAEGLRVIQLTRHELAVAFRGARLRQALEEERTELTAIVEGATDAILQVDEACRVVRINRAALDLLGLAGPAAALGRTCGAVLGCSPGSDGRGHAAEACPLAAALETGLPIAYRESTVRSADGRTVAVAGGYSRGSAGGSGSLRATAILRDVGAAKALEELRESFVATVSHELRTPLALVKGYAETLRHLDLPLADREHAIRRIDELAERLRDLVTQILDVTQLHAHPLVLERAPVSVEAILQRLRADLSIAQGRDRLALDFPSELAPIDGDAGRLEQVLENVVGNALKYAPADTTVLVRGRVADGWLVLEIEDEGIGIPEEDRALVLEPFHRARNVRESNLPGTGLGLAISRRLMEAHGGELRLEGRPDGRSGTRAVLRLPITPTGRDTRPPATVSA